MTRRRVLENRSGRREMPCRDESRLRGGKSSSGATRQSVAEYAVSRLKALVNVELAARKFENQRTEAKLKSRVLNRMTSLAMPRSERIPVG